MPGSPSPAASRRGTARPAVQGVAGSVRVVEAVDEVEQARFRGLVIVVPDVELGDLQLVLGERLTAILEALARQLGIGLVGCCCMSA
jgi:hypothetical protein